MVFVNVGKTEIRRHLPRTPHSGSRPPCSSRRRDKGRGRAPTPDATGATTPFALRRGGGGEGCLADGTGSQRAGWQTPPCPSRTRTNGPGLVGNCWLAGGRAGSPASRGAECPPLRNIPHRRHPKKGAVAASKLTKRFRPREANQTTSQIYK